MAEINKENKFENNYVAHWDVPVAIIQATWYIKCQVMGHVGDSEKSYKHCMILSSLFQY